MIFSDALLELEGSWGRNNSKNVQRHGEAQVIEVQHLGEAQIRKEQLIGEAQNHKDIEKVKRRRVNMCRLVAKHR